MTGGKTCNYWKSLKKILLQVDPLIYLGTKMIISPGIMDAEDPNLIINWLILFEFIEQPGSEPNRSNVSDAKTDWQVSEVSRYSFGTKGRLISHPKSIINVR